MPGEVFRHLTYCTTFICMVGLFVGTPITNFEGEIVTNESIMVKNVIILQHSLQTLHLSTSFANYIAVQYYCGAEPECCRIATTRMLQNKLGGETCTSARASTTGLVKRTTNAMSGIYIVRLLTIIVHLARRVWLDFTFRITLVSRLRLNIYLWALHQSLTLKGK